MVYSSDWLVIIIVVIIIVIIIIIITQVLQPCKHLASELFGTAILLNFFLW